LPRPWTGEFVFKFFFFFLLLSIWIALLHDLLRALVLLQPFSFEVELIVRKTLAKKLQNLGFSRGGGFHEDAPVCFKFFCLNEVVPACLQ
jgi:hypothetical protein